MDATGSDSPPAGSAAMLRRLEARFLRPYRWSIALGLVGLLAQSLLVLPIPLLQGRVVDCLVPLVERPGARSTAQSAAAARVILGALAATVTCLLARSALAWWVAAMMGRISQEVVVAMRAALHGKFMKLPMSYFDAQQTGKLMARVTSDVGSIHAFIKSGFLQLVNDLILSVGVAVLLVWLQWRLAMVALVAVPLYAVNQRYFSHKIRQLSLDIRAQVASIYALLSERRFGSSARSPRKRRSWPSSTSGSTPTAP